MAEEVQISNVGGNGVASEVTLARLVTSIEAMAKKMGISSKGEAAKLQALYNKAVKDSGTATKEATVSTKESTTATKEATRETNKFAATLGNAVSTGLGALAASAVGLTTSLLNNKVGVEEFTSQLPGIGGLLQPFAQYLDNSIDSFRSLSQVGAGFGGSLTNMRTAAADMGLSLGEMTDLFRSNGPALAMLGGSVEQGAARFAKMNKNIKASGDFASLMNLGFSVEEVNEGMADYVALQGRMGRLQGQSTEELAKGSANYLLQIDKLARVTGKTREEAQAALDAQAADSVARTLLNQFDQNTEEGQRAYNNLTASLALLDEVGGGTAEALKGMLTENLTPAAGRFMAMLGDSGDTVHQAMMEVGRGADPQVLLDAFGRAGGKLEEFAGADAAGRVAIIRQLREAGDPMADFLDDATKLTQLSGRNLGEVQRQQDAAKAAADASTAAALQFEQTQRELASKLQTILLDSGLLDKLGSALGVVADIFTGISVSLGEFNTKLQSGEWLSALTGILSDGLAGLWNNAGVIAALTGGIAVMFAGKAVVGAMTKGIASSVGALFGGGGSSTPESPRSRSNAGRGAGNAIGNIGSGIGKGLGGVLKGLAGGISAFANPTVALGAAGLAASIVLIGGAIAGATWMVGKSLPTMAEGLKSFEELDGDALIAAGKGMGAIALGMAAFGAGSAVAGLGSLVGSVTSGIAGLFGGETDPLAQLEKFQEKTFDEAKITANANSIVAYSKAMAALGAAEGLSGIGAAVGAVGGAIAGLFGAEDPLDKMKTFGDYTFNTAGIVANAGAVAAYAAAMKDFPTTPSASVFTAAKDAIIGLLGGNTDPFAPMKQFGELGLNTAGIINNAGAVSAFAAAMQNMPVIDATRTGGVLGAIAGWFAGDEVMPWDSVKAFGDAQINAAGVTANAEAINAMSTSLNNFSIEKLDTTGIISYTNAMEDLVEVLGELNEELSKDNNGWSAGTGENAGSVMSKVQSVGGGGGTNDQLNNIMQQVLLVLNEMRDLDDKVERNTRNIVGSNLAQGGVSNVGR